MDEALDPRWRMVGDPDADALVERLSDSPHWHSALRGSARNGDRPGIPELAQFFGDHARLPTDARADVLARATQWCDAHLSYLSIGMLCGSLPLLFLGAEGAAVLTGTGELVARVDARINRTGAFVLDVTERGGCGPAGRALRAASEVRLIHALVRRSHADKASGTDATPICQQDMVTTLFAFAVMPVRCARRLGVNVTAREAQDHYALWRSLGPALGVRPDLLPESVDDADPLLDALVEANAAPSEAGRALAAALLEGIARHLAVPGRTEAAAWIVRYLIGERLATILSIPDVDSKVRRTWSRLAGGAAVRRLIPLLGRDLHRMIVRHKLRYSSNNS